MIRTLLGASALTLLAGMSSAATLSYSAVVDGAQAMAGSGTGSTATGTATLLVDDADQTLDFSLDVAGITLDQLANGFVAMPVGPIHLHLGVRGENGPVTIPFAFDATYTATMGGFSLIKSDYLFSDALAISGVAPTFAQFVSALDAEGYYVNIHTDVFPSGEIRGQVVPDVAPVPVPAAGLLVLTGLGALGALKRRKAVRPV